MDELRIRGARQHNLKNIDLSLPKNTLIVFTGLSGSGKSSLAFDTIYAEGQRRYVESLSSYARQFLGIMDKPDVDSIEGLSPSISIDQKSASHNPRSTVGTVTEIYDYLRLLFARTGHPHCSVCGREISKQSPQQIVANIFTQIYDYSKLSNSQSVKICLLSPVVRDRKGEFTNLFENLRTKGYRSVRVDSSFIDLREDLILIKTNKHTIEVVIDKIVFDKQLLKSLKDRSVARTSDLFQSIRSRLTDDVEQALLLSQGTVVLGLIKDAGFTIPDKPKQIDNYLYSDKFSCPVDNISLPEIEPRTFSFNSPHGACPTCSGIGNILTVDPDLVLSPELSVSEGGILPFARMFFNDTWFSRLIIAFCESEGIDPRKPLKYMTVKQKNLMLYGTGSRLYRVVGKNRFGDTTQIEEAYEGIVNELKRRYSQSESEYVRLEIERFMRQEICTTCNGKRLKKEVLTITIQNKSISDVTDMSIAACFTWIQTLTDIKADSTDTAIAKPIIKEITARLRFLIDVGLEYLTLSRAANTLSGGEAQRIRLASQIGSGLSGVLYVLDEPSIGLHQKDNSRLIATLKTLRDLGNTVIVVEHDRDTIEQADYIVDFGPGAGEHGGKIISQGSVSHIKSDKASLTGRYLSGSKIISRTRNTVLDKQISCITLHGAKQNNLKDITVSFPKEKFICVTGVSGSGKSTLIVETLYKALQKQLQIVSKEKPGSYEKLTGIEDVDKVILIDQSPIGRTPRSNPATYTGIFAPIRDIYASSAQSRERGYKPGRFSFNVKGGRCEACEGEGQKRIEMQFLSDVYVTCDVCHGLRYNTETLEVPYHDKNIAQTLAMTVDEAIIFFQHIPILREKLQIIADVGLGYIKLGQPAPTLSGGEAQRVKLATELSRRSTNHTVYILDEPTTGLHFADLDKLLQILHRLTDKGNTIIVIEHNLDIIKNADWIIDLGPDGGENGGYVIAQGTPATIANTQNSHTGKYLKHLI